MPPSRAGSESPVWAIVVAGGNGTRFGARKQYALLGGRSVLEWSLEAAGATCDGVVLVLPADDVEFSKPHSSGNSWSADAVVAGGMSRSASVRAGLAAVPADAGLIAVHDAARPLAGKVIWEAVISSVRQGADGAIPTVAVTDTIKSVGAGGALHTLDRSALVAVQTPQAFTAAALRSAHEGAADATDDAALVEAAGGRVVVVPGHSHNLKVTHPDDLVVAAALMSVAGDRLRVAGDGPRGSGERW